MEALGNLGINLSYLVVQILNFFIVMLIMSFWAYKPILKVLDERRDKIAQGLEDAREAEEARANAHGGYKVATNTAGKFTNDTECYKGVADAPEARIIEIAPKSHLLPDLNPY